MGLRGKPRPRVKPGVRVVDAGNPGVEQALAPVRDSVDLLHAHVGDSGVEHHAIVTTERAGFAPAGGGPNDYLRGDGAWSPPTVSVVYVAIGGESDFIVPVARAVPYVVMLACAGVSSVPKLDLPAVDRTATGFRVLSSSALSPGDRLEFLVV